MLKLLERNIATIGQRLVLAAPPAVAIPLSFENVDFVAERRARLVRDVQRVRGSIYLEDGAIERNELTDDGLHKTAEDARSWHLLLLNAERRITACVWYLPHHIDASVDDLRVRNCPLTRLPRWRGNVLQAVQSDISRARSEGLQYAELGGWAVSKENRCAGDGLVLALAAYSLAAIFGGALGITTATVRHSSSTILRRLGGSYLPCGDGAVPSYYDPKYRCMMELLRFDSRAPNPKYAHLIEALGQQIAHAPLATDGTAFAPAYAASGHPHQPVYAA